VIGRIHEIDRLRQVAVDQLKVAGTYLERDLIWFATEKIKESLVTCGQIAELMEKE